MEAFTIHKQRCFHDGRFQDILKFDVRAFYHGNYIAGDKERRDTPCTVENIVCTLKNQFAKQDPHVLKLTCTAWRKIILEDIPLIYGKIQKDFTVCVVPRAKANHTTEQLLFKETIKDVVKESNYLKDGTQYIIRRKNTKTTHLAKTEYGGDGPMPYPGITKDTCEISAEVKGKDILLIDDLYTPGVFIDEDAIQALYDNGATSVVFYALGKTMRIKN